MGRSRPAPESITFADLRRAADRSCWDGSRGRPMTEAEWLVCDDPTAMLKGIRGRSSQRQRRLFACACCRLIWHLIPSAELKHVVAVSESVADETATDTEREAAVSQAIPPDALRHAAMGAVMYASYHDASPGNCIGAASCVYESDPDMRVTSVNVVRCVFGNSFRPFPCSPLWRTDTVRILANQMYESRDFSAMPILADALQDAGCEISNILDHCRGPGPHVRGCWVVDLVLGKV